MEISGRQVKETDDPGEANGGNQSLVLALQFQLSFTHVLWCERVIWKTQVYHIY